MRGLCELLRLLRLSNAELAVWYCDRALQSARIDLAAALQARDQARAEITLHDASHPPLYLLARQEAVVRSIKKERKA